MSNEPPFPEDPTRAPDGPAGPPPGQQPPGPPPGQQPPPYAAPPTQGFPTQGPPTQGFPVQGQPPYGQPTWQGHQAPLQGGPLATYPTPTKPKGRKVWLVVLLSILALVMVAGVIFGLLFLADDDEPNGLAVDDLSSGDCLVSEGFEDGAAKVAGIETVDCDEAHDAEVFATFELEDGEDLEAAGSRCVDEADDQGRPFEDLDDAGLEIRPLVADNEPDAGDEVVCFIRHADGEKLSSPEFD